MEIVKGSNRNVPTIDGKPIINEEYLLKLWSSININKGDTIIVHSSLKSLGYVVGGAECVIDSLIKIVGTEGTIIMPTQTAENTDPSSWHYPPVKKEYWKLIRSSMLPYNAQTTPVTKGIGIIPETFRKYKGVIRTNHPVYSFAIYGKNRDLISSQSLDFGLGQKSPLGNILKQSINAKILLIGTDFDTNTSLHLAEYYLSRKPFIQKSCVIENGKRILKSYYDIPLDIYDDFTLIQKQFEKKHNFNYKKIYGGYASSYDFKEVVNFAIDYYKNKE